MCSSVNYRIIEKNNAKEYLPNKKIFQILNTKKYQNNNFSSNLQNKFVDKFLEEKILRIQNSPSYKIGRAITFLPRKIRDNLRKHD